MYSYLTLLWFNKCPMCELKNAAILPLAIWPPYRICMPWKLPMGCLWWVSELSQLSGFHHFNSSVALNPMPTFPSLVVITLQFPPCYCAILLFDWLWVMDSSVLQNPLFLQWFYQQFLCGGKKSDHPWCRIAFNSWLMHIVKASFTLCLTAFILHPLSHLQGDIHTFKVILTCSMASIDILLLS